MSEPISRRTADGSIDDGARAALRRAAIAAALARYLADEQQPRTLGAWRSADFPWPQGSARPWRPGVHQWMEAERPW